MEEIVKTFHYGSEAYGEGHSDKLCDFICDAILDCCLEQDPNTFVEIEAITKTGLICIVGKIQATNTINIDIEHKARECCKDLGYDNSEKGLDYRNVNIISTVEILETSISELK